jgi:hypothetical protein
MDMKGPVVAIGGFLTVIYLSAVFTAALRTQAPRPGAQRTSAPLRLQLSRSREEAFKAGFKTPGELLRQNKELSDKLTTILKQQSPSVTDLQAASQGFKVLILFVAAVHMSHNLGIPFDQLETQAQTSGSYGRAIHVLKPEVDAKAEVLKAAEQAVDDMQESRLGS